MTTITTVQNGDWNDNSTWNGGAVPTSADNVVIVHAVTFSASIMAKTIRIGANGSLTIPGNWQGISTITVTTDYFDMVRRINDDRVVRIDGANLIITHPTITSIGTYSNDGFPTVSGLYASEVNGIIIDDPGLYGFSAQMQDIKPEGCARAYARKVSNGVRYMNLNIHIKANNGNFVGLLYRMAELPFQVLAVTNSAIIKGYIEAITPVDSVGKEYRSFRISIAEGL